MSDSALQDSTITDSSSNANINLSESNEILLTIPEEFDTFIDKHTHLFLINTKILLKKEKESSEIKRKSLSSEYIKNI